MTPLDTALTYIRRGWNPVPLPFGTKKPVDEGWQRRIIDEASAPRHFNGTRQNIGLVLGPTSRGLTDVDLDCAEAIALAPYLLPQTNAIFGRASRPASHWLYVTDLSEGETQAKRSFKEPASGRMVVELRVGGASGAQTVFPGSVHESGEVIEWEKSGEPAKVDGTKLKSRIVSLAIASLLVRYWPPEGARHDAGLITGGFLARAGWSTEQIKHAIGAVASVAKDPEWKDRQKAAGDAAEAYKLGKKTYGLPALREMFGEPVSDRIAEWLGYRDANPIANHTGKEQRSNDIITEDGAAQQFVELYRDRLRFCHDAGSWFEWDVVSWQQNRTGRAFQWARELARRLSDSESAKVRYVTSKTSFASGVERFARTDPAFAVTTEAWDQDPWLLGTPEGTVDLRTGRLRASVPTEGITKTTAVGPADTVDCLRWLAFLDQATGNDDDLVRFLQQWCGYCLTGITREHALVFVYGPGGNGNRFS